MKSALSAPGVALGTGRILSSQRSRHVTKQAQGLALRPHLLSQERNRYFRIGASDPVIQGEGEVEGGGEWKLILKLIFHLFLFYPKQKSALPPSLTIYTHNGPQTSIPWFWKCG